MIRFEEVLDPSEKLIAACQKSIIADDAAEKAEEAARIAEAAWKRKVNAALLLARKESGDDRGRGSYLSRPAAEMYATARRIAEERIEAERLAHRQEAPR